MHFNEIIFQMTKIERIRDVVKWLINEGVAPNQFGVAKLLGYTNESSLSKVLNEKTSLPANLSHRLAALDSRLNEAWISEGWGQMVKEDKFKHANEPEQPYNKITNMERIIKAQEKTIEALERENELLRMQLGIRNKQTGT